VPPLDTPYISCSDDSGGVAPATVTCSVGNPDSYTDGYTYTWYWVFTPDTNNCTGSTGSTGSTESVRCYVTDSSVSITATVTRVETDQHAPGPTTWP
jgi:hypothetical protein